jgi:hypothetical protein
MFDADLSQIELLDSKQLVQLLGRLLHAEAQNAGVPLSGISVPIQITIADDGEDGRIVWQDGLASTGLPTIPCHILSVQGGTDAAGRLAERMLDEIYARQGQDKEANSAAGKARS